ncbi:FAD-dependent oxidoreductase [Amycolatopsis sp. FDAARGOS 1241]|uniref:FAD-dependent oxidoreductase n=1 Tax=Amycolatopsis sp. FDAARGOS 1241 TaxID=2778070 RepID=UPI00194EDB4D|nr:FAD-dependent oxidoreductase [Amycolatopsis sp. FDAARGOS 1241]QRP50172.1 hypothetical protein I6J71_22185 [Amycolatopsis sp. FDAARGOS 1241]
MESVERADLLVIGFGKGGKAAAGAMARLGKRVVVEQSPEMYGGTCPNVGCVPTKALVHRSGNRRPTGNVDFAEFVGGGVEDGHPTGAAGSYRIARDGRLTPISTAVPARSTPLDLGLNPDGKNPSNVLPGSGKVAAWRIGAHGELTKAGDSAAFRRPRRGSRTHGLQRSRQPRR